MPRNLSGRWFEELEPGLVVEHAITRTVTEADNVLFTCLTMNPQPMHLDAEFAAQHEFGEPLMNSMFTLGLVVGIAVPELTLGTTVANLGFESVEFPNPVFAGDTIWVSTEVVGARASRSRPEAGIVTFEHSGFNQRDQLICRAPPRECRRRTQPDGSLRLNGCVARDAGGTRGTGATRIRPGPEAVIAVHLEGPFRVRCVADKGVGYLFPVIDC